MPFVLRRHAFPFATALLSVTLAACTVAPPPPPVAGGDLGRVRLQSLHAEPGRAVTEEGASVPAQWWTLFHDASLDALEAKAIRSNLSLKTSLSRVDQSRAQLGLSDARLAPQLGLGGGYTRSAISANAPTAMLGAPTYGFDLWNVGLQASWEIDLWGYLKQLKAAALADMEAEQFAHDAAQVALTAEVAQRYVQLRGIEAQQLIAQRQLALTHESLHLAQRRQEHGIATEAEVAAARADEQLQVARTQALSLQHAALLNALSLLLAEPPQQLSVNLNAQAGQVPLAPHLPVGLPSELARRRPDILQAEAHLRAATANVGAAQADFYPRISLNGSFAMVAFHGSDLGNWDSREYAVGPTLYLPIFDGGRLKRTLALSEAAQQQAAIHYQQTVLQAWHEIDDALDAVSIESARKATLQEAAHARERGLHAAQRQLAEGAVDRQVPMQSEQQWLGTLAMARDNEAANALAVIQLYRALGGGWMAPEAHAEAQP